MPIFCPVTQERLESHLDALNLSHYRGEEDGLTRTAFPVWCAFSSSIRGVQSDDPLVGALGRQRGKMLEFYFSGIHHVKERLETRFPHLAEKWEKR